MKILHVIENMDESTGGGSTERTRQLSLHLSEMGHEVSILTTDYVLSKSTIKDLGQIKIIAMPILIRRFYIPRLLFQEIKKAVKNSDIILIVSHWSIINLAIYFYHYKILYQYQIRTIMN